LPYLAAAVTRFLQEYPWTVDGLSRTERRVLELASGDGIALSAAFWHMHDGETVYYITDTSLAGLAEELSRTSPPLLTLALGSAGNDEGLRGTVLLTDNRTSCARQAARQSRHLRHRSLVGRRAFAERRQCLAMG
jgi:hypothetical protein